MEPQFQNESERETKKKTRKISYLFKILLWTFLIALILKSFFIEAYKIPTSSMEKTLLAGDFILVSKASYSLALPGALPLINVKLPEFTFLSHSKPSRGNIIVFLFSENWNEKSEKHNYIKRIIGEPGDTIQIVNNQIYINRRRLLDDRINLGERIKDVESDKNILPNGIIWNGINMDPFVVPSKGLTIQLTHTNINLMRQLINREYGKNIVSIEGTVINIEGIPARTYTFKRNHYFVMGDNQKNSMDSRHWGTIPENLITGKASVVYWSQDSDYSFPNSIRFKRIFQIVK